MLSKTTDNIYKKHELYHYIVDDIHDPEKIHPRSLYFRERKVFTLDLKNQWRVSTTIQPPSGYHGVYESFSNWHVSNGIAYTTITVSGGSGEFELYVASYGEANYDCVYCGKLDTIPVRGTVSTLQANTMSYNTGGTSLSKYLKVTYDIPDSNEHTITIMYWKDGSNDGSGTDRGYLLIPSDSEYKMKE